jgi:hypothetical protein
MIHDISIVAWQGWQFIDQTFDDEIDFDLDEIRMILDEPILVMSL